MDITLLLASLWGPALLLIGIGMFISRAYYTRIYRDLEKDTLAVFLIGMVMLVAGIAQVLFHSIWNTLPQIVISLLGWATLVKGAVFIVAPSFVDKAGDRWANMNLIPVAGALMLLIGGYVTWVAYFV
ncbi:hypothetical protein KJ819_03290 [Patescibacteria group bacterium]|nr:hypothetical protein [Patescibacteria group bacterium]MBU1500688.1 hypothetical protein [Patescibacteria group bacterium]MBU2080759.1 hypothetical protein [Patescibacteria group bacterium]MBU2123864.1 hypothetical protein [Patescibacteria group bacterium]MBU2194845.1 hypothetical protein [Patescibacteria group bacterium]